MKRVFVFMKRGNKFIDISGRRFGRIIAIEYHSTTTGNSKEARWFCQCDCGKTKVILSSSLRNGLTHSCGCLRAENLTKHGHAKRGQEALYHIWYNMKQRVLDPAHKSFKDYGARGIAICDRWLNSVDDFISDMGPRPAKHTLERKNNDGNYEPSNCVWASMFQQGNNRRTNRWIEHNGERKTISQWSRILNVPEATIGNRNDRGVKIDFPTRKSKKSLIAVTHGVGVVSSHASSVR